MILLLPILPYFRRGGVRECEIGGDRSDRGAASPFPRGRPGITLLRDAASQPGIALFRRAASPFPRGRPGVTLLRDAASQPGIALFRRAASPFPRGQPGVTLLRDAASRLERGFRRQKETGRPGCSAS
jgi:hypothetical protein